MTGSLTKCETEEMIVNLNFFFRIVNSRTKSNHKKLTADPVYMKNNLLNVILLHIISD